MTSLLRPFSIAIALAATAGVVPDVALASRSMTASDQGSMLAAPLSVKYDDALKRRLQLADRDADSTATTYSTLDVLILLEGRADRKGLGAFRDPVAKRAALNQRLRETAASSQSDLLGWLDAQGVAHRAFWIANAVSARIPVKLLPALAERSDVRAIESDAAHRSLDPAQAKSEPTKLAGETWGVLKIGAPDVWAQGYRGQGVVIGGQDTGYAWEHPALKDKYRGWNGIAADHNYSWHDAIHALINGPTANSCGLDVMAPCDDHYHGTHTMGTMIGDDGAAEKIGVAPDAKWIGCRNMEEGDGRPSTYIECFQWFVEPTDLANANPDASKAPDVINNSWGCPPSELCDASANATMSAVVENVRDAGIVVVVSAGNYGENGVNDCSTVEDPAAIFPASLTVGATSSTDAIADFSSRGPVVGGLLKPNVSAPGVAVRSSIPGGTYANLQGTSMAGPHVAGAVALIISANPSLRGDPDTIQAILESTAVQLTSMQDCGGYPGSAVPNAVFGYGRIDAYAAVQAALALIPVDTGVFDDGFEQ